MQARSADPDGSSSSRLPGAKVSSAWMTPVHDAGVSRIPGLARTSTTNGRFGSRSPASSRASAQRPCRRPRRARDRTPATRRSRTSQRRRGKPAPSNPIHERTGGRGRRAQPGLRRRSGLHGPIRVDHPAPATFERRGRSRDRPRRPAPARGMDPHGCRVNSTSSLRLSASSQPSTPSRPSGRDQSGRSRRGGRPARPKARRSSRS